MSYKEAQEFKLGLFLHSDTDGGQSGEHGRGKTLLCLLRLCKLLTTENAGATYLLRRNNMGDIKKERFETSLAGVQGFEPRLADPESAVLPLNDTPLLLAWSIIPYSGSDCQAPGDLFFANCQPASNACRL